MPATTSKYGNTKVTTELVRAAGGGNLLAALNANQGANIASAATTDIASATGEFVYVTGTTTITALGTAQAGTLRSVVFSGILKLTSSVNILLPGSVDIYTAANDIIQFRSLGAGVWILSQFIRSSANIIASVVQSAALSLTTATSLTIASITLPAGKWRISAMIGYLFGTATSVTVLRGGVSLTNNTLPASDTTAVPTAGETIVQGMSEAVGIVKINGGVQTMSIPSYDVFLTVSTTFYLIGRSTFTVNTNKVFGSILAEPAV